MFQRSYVRIKKIVFTSNTATTNEKRNNTIRDWQPVSYTHLQNMTFSRLTNKHDEVGVTETANSTNKINFGRSLKYIILKSCNVNFCICVSTRLYLFKFF